MRDFLFFTVGQTSSLTRTVSEADVEAFALATGDRNPVHLDAAFAATTRFGRRIAHGMLVGSYISTLLGTKFPGPGTIYVSQNLSFRKPVFIGDTLLVSATVKSFRPEKAIVVLETVVTNQAAETVLLGEAVCLVSELVGTLDNLPSAIAGA